MGFNSAFKALIKGKLIFWLFVLATHWLIFGRVLEIAKIDYYLRHVRQSAWNNSTPTRRIFTKLGI